MKNRKTLIIILTFNEEENISPLIKSLKSVLPSADICIIDGGSKDNTVQYATQAGAMALKVPYSIGIAGAVETGFKFAYEMGYEMLARIDGDGQHDPKELIKMISPIESNLTDMVIGSRYISKRVYRPSIFRLLGTKLFSFVISSIIKQKISDPTSGLQVFNSKVIRYLAEELPGDYSEVEMLILLHRAGFRIMELPTPMTERQEGKSSFTILRSFFYVFRGMVLILISIFQNIPLHEGENK